MRTFFLLLFVFNPLIADDPLILQLKSNRFQTIKFEDLIAINKTIRLSDIATDVQYVVLETNENCLIDKYPGYYFSDTIIFIWKNSTGQATLVGLTNYEPLYSYNNTLFFKTVYNDTVFTIKNNKIVPEYFIDLGKYKLSDNKILEQFSPQEIDRNSYTKYYKISVFESGGKKFITATPFFGQSKHFILTQNNFVESTTKTIFNDWDGGYVFWPQGSVNDNQVFMPIEVMTLKKFFASKESPKIKVTSPLSETNLKNIVKNADESNNPILMIVTLKSSSKSSLTTASN